MPQGLVTRHFAGKQALWEAAVDWLFAGARGHGHAGPASNCSAIAPCVRRMLDPYEDDLALREAVKGTTPTPWRPAGSPDAPGCAGSRSRT